jgi:hypothetical protein
MKVYQLSDGLREGLQAFLASEAFKAHLGNLASEVDSGAIGEESLSILVAMDQVSSKRDSRLTEMTE